MPHSIANAESDLYETDFYAWTQDQAARLRRLHERAVNLDLDLPRLAEEVEDLGKAERNAVRSRLIRIIEHCLKLEYSRAEAPRRGWHEGVIDARGQLGMEVTRSLRRDLDRDLPRLYELGRARTVEMLRLYGEADIAGRLPVDCPYSLEDLLREQWYPASRHGHAP